MGIKIASVLLVFSLAVLLGLGCTAKLEHERIITQDISSLVQEYRTIIRAMFSEGALRTDLYEGKVYLRPCSDGPRLSHMHVGQAQFEYYIYDFSQGRYQLRPNLDESIKAEIESYFQRYVAYQVELARFQATTAGYPASVFHEILDQMVAKALSKPNYPAGVSERDTIPYDILLEKLRLYWHVHPDLPEPQLGEGCGDGGITAIIQLDPPDARVWLISEFDYRLCELRGYDPKDRENCRWREETGHIFSVVGGNYRFYAEWKDGRSVFGRSNFFRGYSDSDGDPGKLFVSASGEKIWADFVVFIRP